MACVDWKKIKAEYIAGGTSYRKLSAKYHYPLSNIERKAKEERWPELRRQAECKATAKAINAVGDKGAKIDEKYFHLVDMLFDKAEEVIASTPTWSASAFKDMASAIKSLKECKGIKSEADIREQEARIAKLQKEAMSEADKDNEIKVTIEGDLELYSK